MRGLLPLTPAKGRSTVNALWKPLPSASADQSRAHTALFMRLLTCFVMVFYIVKVRGPVAFVERARLRVELDGIIAHLYELTEEEFTCILTAFPLVASR